MIDDNPAEYCGPFDTHLKGAELSGIAPRVQRTDKMARSPRPNVSDGVITALAVAVIGAPEVLGPRLPHLIGEALFWGGIVGAALYVIWRWGAYFLGATESSEGRLVDNRGGRFVGSGNASTIVQGDVNINQVPSANGAPTQNALHRAFEDYRYEQYRTLLKGRRSDLKLTVGEDGRYFETKASHGIYGIRRIFKLRCDNVGTEKALARCKITLTKTNPPSEYQMPWVIFENFEVSAGDHVFIPLVSFGEARDAQKTDCSDTFLEIFPAITGSPKLEKGQPHILEIRATSADTGPFDFKCRVWVENGRLKIEHLK